MSLPRSSRQLSRKRSWSPFPARERRRFATSCSGSSPSSCRSRRLPDLKDLVNGKVGVKQIRPLAIEDLLPRSPVTLRISDVRALVKGKRVLVTGAGGSIGSELCRQIVALEPANLILYERYENSLYAVTNDLIEHGTRGVDLPGDRRRHRRRSRRCRVRQVSTASRLPCGRPQARAADGEQPVRGRQEQRAAEHARSPRPRRSLWGRALRPDLHGQGGESLEHHGRDQARRRADRAGDERGQPPRDSSRSGSATCWAATAA